MSIDLIRKKDKVIEIIKKKDDFLIISHNYPDGDSLGTQAALYDLMISLGKSARMICNSEIPYQYMFLPHMEKLETDVSSIEGETGKYVSFTVDSATVDRLNIDFESLKEVSEHIINIDHHKDNSLYGSIDIIEPLKSATAEIIFEVIKKGFPTRFNENIAVGLYTAILTDTGKFQYSSTSASVHEIVAYLIEIGVKPEEIYSKVYENEPIERFKLLGRVLSRVSFDEKTKTLHSFVLKDDFIELRLPFSAHNGIIEMLRSAKGAHVVALFKEVEKKHFKVSLRSSGKADVSIIASELGGGGHKMAAAYEYVGDLASAVRSLIEKSEVKQDGI